jgi:hypothetical protein
MASMMKDLATGDISNQRENIMMLAQLMGQKITSDQDLKMFQEQLQANMQAASNANEAAINGAAIQAGAHVIGAMA